jgi:hypothetical protein
MKLMKTFFIQQKENRDPKGFVAIITVLLFTVLVSVLTIGFLRIMTDQSEQVIEDDLSKGALAAAESGVEDGKRVLRHCRGLTGIDRSTCYGTLESETTCPGIYSGSSPLTLDLGLHKVSDTDSIQIGDPALNQRTTCTLINIETPDVVGQARNSLDDLIPLKSSDSFNHVAIEWHKFTDDGNAAVPNNVVSSTNPQFDNWKSGGVAYPAMLRVELVQFHEGQTIDSLTTQYTTFLVPTNSGSSSANLPGSGRQLIVCSTSGTYACRANISVPAFNAAGHDQYFLLISSVYSQPHYRLTMQDGADPVNFVDVQPSIDVTGASGDVFRRVIARVAYKTDTYFTHNAIEAGGAICKDFTITIGGASSTSGCLSALP